MKPITGLCLVTLGGVVLSTQSLSSIHTEAYSFEIDEKGAGRVQSKAAMDPLAQGEEIVFAEFSFHDELPLDTEVELWPQIEGDIPPWDLPRESFPFHRILWAIDERTGTLVRFDVTGIVQAWNRGDLPNLGFVLRTISDSEEELQEGAVGIGFRSPKDARLSYRTAEQPSGKSPDPARLKDDKHPGAGPRPEKEGGPQDQEKR